MLLEKVGMPTVKGVQSSMMDYAVGLGGGLIYALSTAFTGSGLLGGLLGAGIAGSVVKGTRGTAIATVLGFQTIIGAASQSQATPEAQQEVM